MYVNNEWGHLGIEKLTMKILNNYEGQRGNFD
jgi:hypothetical protein